MIDQTLLETYQAVQAKVLERSGRLTTVESGDQRYTFSTWCTCAAAEFAVYPNTHPFNDTGSVNVLCVCQCAPHTYHGQRMKTPAEFQAEYDLTADVCRRIGAGFTFNRVTHGSVPRWGDPRYSKKREAA
jgi:hypothetical protein